MAVGKVMVNKGVLKYPLVIAGVHVLKYILTVFLLYTLSCSRHELGIQPPSGRSRWRRKARRTRTDGARHLRRLAPVSDQLYANYAVLGRGVE